MIKSPKIIPITKGLRCTHSRVYLDEKRRLATCSICKVKIDHFDLLLHMSKQKIKQSPNRHQHLQLL